MVCSPRHCVTQDTDCHSKGREQPNQVLEAEYDTSITRGKQCVTLPTAVVRYCCKVGQLGVFRILRILGRKSLTGECEKPYFRALPGSGHKSRYISLEIFLDFHSVMQKFSTVCICAMNNCPSMKQKINSVLCFCYKVSPCNFPSSTLISEGDKGFCRPVFSSIFANSVLEMRSYGLARLLEADKVFFCLSYPRILVPVTGIDSQ